MIRQPIIAVLGHVDHGKCLSGKEKVYISEKGVVELKKLFESSKRIYYKDKEKEVRILNEKIQLIDEHNKNTTQHSLYIWKVKHDGELIKVKLKNWWEIEVTPEHPFLTTKGWKKAKDLKDDYVAVPSKLLSYDSLENMMKYILDNIMDKNLIVKLVPKTIEEWKSLFYLAGVFFRLSTKISNNSDDAFLKKLLKKANLNLEIKRVKRRTVYDIELMKAKNAFLRFLQKVFEFPKKQKSNTIKCPNILFIAPKELTSEFLKGYFDCDSYVDINNNYIEVESASKDFIYGLSLVLLRYGIFSKIYIKKIKNKEYAILRIKGRDNLKAFKKYINYTIKYKAKRLNEIIKKSKKDETYPIKEEVKRLRILFGFTKNELNKYIPYYSKCEENNRFSKKIIKKLTSILKRGPKNLEKKIKVLEGKIKDVNYLKAFERDGLIKEGKLTELGKEVLEIWKNKEFKKYEWQLDILANLIENINFVPVEKIEKIPFKGYVYDLTTSLNNFVANGIIVHNTTLLDAIRKTTVAQKEAGRITQHIGATEVPKEIIENICKDLIQQFKIEIKIPGLLFIDTPGHEAFTNLRKRGGSIADFAVLVIDINQGIQPQTVESLNILREFKVPFLIATTKVDTIIKEKEYSFLKVLKKIDPRLEVQLDEKIYKLIGDLSQYGFNAERFDRVTDFTREVVIIPTSGVTGLGIAELLLFITGLSQKYLKNRLEIDENSPVMGNVLEVKEMQGVGLVADSIIYEGKLKVGDTIYFMTLEGIKETKVKALLKPKPLKDIRVVKEFYNVDEVYAASGVRIVGQDLEGIIPGSPISTNKELVQKEMKVDIETSEEGVIIKADTIGSLEALAKLLKANNIPISKYGIGEITKEDIAFCEVMREKNRYLGVILGFNVKPVEAEVPIIVDNVIYKILEKYEQWKIEEREREKKEKLEKITLPVKLKVLPQYIFRKSDPAIFGVKILKGVLKPGFKLMDSEGLKVGEVKGIQSNNMPLKEAKEGEEVAISVQGGVIGRNIDEDDTLYSFLTDEEIKILRSAFHLLDESQKEVLREIIEIKLKKAK
jgi:translation initiation factor 5B